MESAFIVAASDAACLLVSTTLLRCRPARLQRLDLSGNAISDAGARGLADCIAELRRKAPVGQLRGSDERYRVWEGPADDLEGVQPLCAELQPQLGKGRVL